MTVSHLISLPRSTPEEQGVSSAGILAFLTEWEGGSLRSEPHSFMLLRHGHVVAEGWWAPYGPDVAQTLYSVSKSITSIAVGLAVSEGLFDIDDPVINFFPDKLPAAMDKRLARLTVANLLTMTVGHATDHTFEVANQPDWISAFLALPLAHEPGAVFVYNTMATYMLSAIIQVRSGMPMLDYLQPRLFAPLGASGMRWETCPNGINTGGWGFSATTATVASTGQLLLQGGRWNGRQLLPEEWVRMATGYMVQQPASWTFMGPSNPDADLTHLKAVSDYYQGYGFQFWRGRHNSYRADGALAQYCIMLPDKDAVIALTSESPDMQGVLDLVWTHLLPAMNDTPLEPDMGTADALLARLASRRLSPPAGETGIGAMLRIAGTSFDFEANTLGARRASFMLDGSTLLLRLSWSDGISEIRCGLAQWLDGVTDLPGTPPSLFAGCIGPRRVSQVAGACAWRDGRTLELDLRFVGTPHRNTLTCRFDGDGIELHFMNSVTQAFTGPDGMPGPFPEIRPVLRGTKVSN